MVEIKEMEAEKNGGVKTPKSFFTVGPTLHYSHNNVRRFFILATLSYIATWLVWSKLLTGNLVWFPENWADPEKLWGLGGLVLSPVSIFEYPMQIIVLGILMGILAVIPTLVSQLLSFRHSLLFVVIAAVLGKPVGFSLFVFVSCLGAASRPLRFRSRIVAIALCLAPQVVYWGVFGRIESLEPLKTAFGFFPWVCAWLSGLAIAGFVLGIGHFTRYKPGLIFAFNVVAMAVAGWLFQWTIGLAELDYQLYVARNDPEKVEEFFDKNISKELNATVERMLKRKSSYNFYPTNKGELRARIISDLQNELRWDRWLVGFIDADKFNYQRKRNELFEQYDKFISPGKRWWMPQVVHDKLITGKARHKRMPIALYYKGLLREYQPDIGYLGRKEILRFDNDFPQRGNWGIWFELYSNENFHESVESIEARWRIAMHLAGEGKFNRADELCDIALNMIIKELAERAKDGDEGQFGFRLFKKSDETVMDEVRLEDLRFRINELKALISKGNRGANNENRVWLGRFVRLNPCSLGYSDELEGMLSRIGGENSLQDNILIAKIMLVDDAMEKASQLEWLAKNFAKTDGGIRARYELALMEIQLWKSQSDENMQEKMKYLEQARKSLLILIADLDDEHFLKREAIKRLSGLPSPQ